MTRARSPTASSTTRSNSSFSSSVVVGDSPVVPETTRPSHPASIRWFANCAAVAVSSEPSARNGVTIAVRTVPNRAGASNPAVLTVFRLPGEGKVFSTRTGAPVCSGLSSQRAGCDLGPVCQRGDLEVGEHRGRRLRQPAQILDGQAPDFHVGVLTCAHGDEVAPGPLVPRHHDAGFGRVGQHRPSGLTGLFTAQDGIGLV